VENASFTMKNAGKLGFHHEEWWIFWDGTTKNAGKNCDFNKKGVRNGDLTMATGGLFRGQPGDGILLAPDLCWLAIVAIVF